MTVNIYPNTRIYEYGLSADADIDTWLDASSSGDIVLGGAASLVDIPSWTVSAGLVADDPDGDWYQFRMSVDASAIIHIISSSFTNDTTGMIRWSADLKAGEMITGATSSYVALYNTTNSNAYQIFDLTNGTLGTTGAGAIDASITPLPGGGYRCSYISPANLSTSGVRVYFLRGNVIATLQGDGYGTFYIKNNVITQQRISGWNSKGSSPTKIDFVQATAANQPIIISDYTTNQVNSVDCPIWQMNNGGDSGKSLSNSDKSLYRFIHDGTGSTMCILYKHLDSTDGANEFLILDAVINTPGFSIFKSSGDVDKLTWRMQNNGAIIATATTPTLVNGNVYLLSYRFSSSSYSVKINGVEIASGVPSAAPDPGDSNLILSIGRNATTNTAFRFCVRDIIMYRSYLSDTKMALVENRLMYRGGI